MGDSERLCQWKWGWLIFVISQKGKDFQITGVNNAEKVEQDFLSTLRSEKFNIMVDAKHQLLNIEKKHVVAFYIAPSNKKPVYFNAQSNTFIRRGSADQRATKEEIDAMYRDQSFGTKTSELVSETSRFSLNDTSLSRYRDYMSRFNPDVSYNRYGEAEFLQKLRIMEGDSCTYGGLLFLGKRDDIEKHFPDFRIDLLEIPTSAGHEATVRYTFRLDEYDNLWEYYFECFARLKPKVDVTFQLTDQGFGQELSPGLNAIREAFVNMLMHADYFSPAHPRIRIFEDHIEFFNPGGLPKPLNELKEKDLSMARNPVISKLFRMVKLAENVGFGLDKIESNWKTYNQTIPVYEEAFDSTLIKLSLTHSANLVDDVTSAQGWEEKEKSGEETWEKVGRRLGEKLGEKLGENLIKTVWEIQQNLHITTADMSKAIGVSTTTIDRNLKKLKKWGVIEREGTLKTGQWKFLMTDLQYSTSELGAKEDNLFSKEGWEKTETRLGEKLGERLGERLGENMHQILQLMYQNPKISTSEISLTIGVSTTAVDNNIKKLKEKGVVQRVGPDKGGHWQILIS